MKATIMAVVVVGAIGLLLQFTYNSETVVVMNERAMEVAPEEPEVIEVKELDRRVQEAQDKAKIEIESKAKSAFDSAYNQAMDEVKLEVVKEYKKEVQQLETDLSKKVGQY